MLRCLPLMALGTALPLLPGLLRPLPSQACVLLCKREPAPMPITCSLSCVLAVPIGGMLRAHAAHMPVLLRCGLGA